VQRIIRARKGLATLDLGELWAYRELVYFFAWRDILVRYKQTVIGVAWAFIRPLFTTIVLTIIFGKIAKLPTAGGLPTPVVALAGVVMWQLFATAFSDASGSVVGNSQLVSRVYFPRLVLPMSAVFSAVVDALITLVMLAALLVWYRIPVSTNIVWAPLFLVLCLAVALAGGIWFSAASVRYRDVRHLLPFIVQIGLYLSPVGFSSSLVPERWRFLYSLNPMVGVIDGFRWALFGGRNPLYPPALAISLTLTLVVLIAALFYFRTTERVFADVI
jgi:lipopolysaccharide transport system permease protein